MRVIVSVAVNKTLVMSECENVKMPVAVEAVGSAKDKVKVFPLVVAIPSNEVHETAPWQTAQEWGTVKKYVRFTMCEQSHWHA